MHRDVMPQSVRQGVTYDANRWLLKFKFCGGVFELYASHSEPASSL